MKNSKYRIYVDAIKVRELIAKLSYILFYINNPYASYNKQANCAIKPSIKRAKFIILNQAMYHLLHRGTMVFITFCYFRKTYFIDRPFNEILHSVHCKKKKNISINKFAWTYN